MGPTAATVGEAGRFGQPIGYNGDPKLRKEVSGACSYFLGGTARMAHGSIVMTDAVVDEVVSLGGTVR